ncbi:MAG TPA: isoaspartyl peptidase/L-asparaginase [Candidatus Polarisedimenticolaceae bacterium]|nr:isoaspartyl peptidase/L-asparaginase [Candidatus Polarisedimenticolaceae bacterium]
MPIALIVHGGAWNIPDAGVEASREGVRRVLVDGWEALRRGAPAIDVVETILRALEDDPHFDAGRGSRLNREGKVELDAALMLGTNLEAGAVAAVQGVRHPISVARLVMERSQHVMLAGEGARKFAREAGAELCRTRDLLVGREYERYMRVLAGEQALVDEEFHDGVTDRPEGTVGAVALDRERRIVAGTSTGGTQHKLPGRVGDTPIIGAGTYADDLIGGASATGWGEGILRVALTKAAVDYMEEGLDPAGAGRRALDALRRVNGRAGLILLDRQGRVAGVFNTPRMARGWATENDGPRVAIEADEGS